MMQLPTYMVTSMSPYQQMIKKIVEIMEMVRVRIDGLDPQ
jgi:hypothetical protein